MTPERWRQVENLYQAALNVEAPSRTAFLLQACPEDAELRREVESLLIQTSSSGELLTMAIPISADTAGASPNRFALSIGATFGPYIIEELLGVGGMACVYRARDTRLNRSVAIKFLAADFQEGTARMRFQREVQIVSALNHPNMLTVHDTGDFAGRPYVVTEFLDGGTLYEWAREKHTLPEILDRMIRVAEGLSAAHAAGILHRDVKPSNILLTTTGHVKLADFGVAKLLQRVIGGISDGPGEARTRTGAILGTLAYMSPEQASGGVIDRRSDIFSFGVVLYELIARGRPFGGDTDQEVLLNILQKDPKPLPQKIPILLRVSVEKSLEKQPGNRYQSIDEMVVDLKRVQRSLDLSSDLQPARKQLNRHLPKALLYVATIGVLVAAGLFYHLTVADYFWRNPLAGARAERLTDFEGDESDPAITLDGRTFAFISHREKHFDVLASQIGSGEIANLTNNRLSALGPGVIRRLNFSNDGAHVYVLDGEGTGPYTTWRIFTLGGVPHPFLAPGMEPAWSPDGSLVAYHTSAPGDPIFVADSTGMNPRCVFRQQAGLHCHYLKWSHDGRFLYFVRGTPTTDQLDIWRLRIDRQLRDAVPEKITSHNARISYVDWLDEHNIVYSGTAEDGAGQWLYSLDVRRKIKHRISPESTEQYLSVAVSSARPRRLITAVANPTANLWTAPITKDVQDETAVSSFPVSQARAVAPRFASGYMLFLSSRDGRDGIWKLYNGAATELWNGSNGGVVAAPAISRDGSAICFSYRKQGRNGLYLMSSDGTNIRAVAEDLDVRGAATWSPDQKWLVVAASQAAGTYLFKVPVDGGAPVRLLHKLSYNPLWSLDGTFLVYSEPLKGGASVTKAIRPDNTEIPFPQIELMYTTSDPYRFVNGGKSMIVLRGTSPTRQNFYRVDIATGQQHQLTNLKTDFVIRSFDITPDGKQIVFERMRNNSDILLFELRN